MITQRIASLLCLNLLVALSGVLAQSTPADAVVTLRVRDLQAVKVAMSHFRRLNPGVDLKHYDLELTRRPNEFEIVFIADDPDRHPPPDARTGSGTIYGPDMTYIMSIPQLKIVRYSFHR